MVGNSESCTLSATNGCSMENIIKTLYPGAEFEYNGLIDLSINGKRVEIKSCQDRIKDSTSSTGRSGRFIFRQEQHEALIENAGDYIFLVHKEGIPIIYVRAPACKIDLLKYKGSMSLCWKTVIKEAIA